MCANFKPITPLQISVLDLPPIPFVYEAEVFPSFLTPLLFKSTLGLEWRMVNFGLIPKWADDKDIAKHTYNARNETIMQKPSFSEAFNKCQFGVVAVTEFYESKYVNGRPQRWGVKRKDGKAFYLAALYEITRLASGEVVRSATLISMDAHDHEIMREFHEPRTDKRSVIVIAHSRLEEWLMLKQPDISPFIEGFSVEEFECFYCPKQRNNKNSPQIEIFDE